MCDRGKHELKWQPLVTAFWECFQTVIRLKIKSILIKDPHHLNVLQDILAMPITRTEDLYAPKEKAFQKHCGKRRHREHCGKRYQELCPFYTPVEDGTYYGITRGGRAGVQAGGRRPVLCPEHISKTTLARVMKFHGWIDLIQGECSVKES